MIINLSSMKYQSCLDYLDWIIPASKNRSINQIHRANLRFLREPRAPVAFSPQSSLYIAIYICRIPRGNSGVCRSNRTFESPNSLASPITHCTTNTRHACHRPHRTAHTLHIYIRIYMWCISSITTPGPTRVQTRVAESAETKSSVAPFPTHRTCSSLVRYYTTLIELFLCHSLSVSLSLSLFPIIRSEWSIHRSLVQIIHTSPYIFFVWSDEWHADAWDDSALNILSFFFVSLHFFFSLFVFETSSF